MRKAHCYVNATLTTHTQDKKRSILTFLVENFSPPNEILERGNGRGQWVRILETWIVDAT